MKWRCFKKVTSSVLIVTLLLACSEDDRTNDDEEMNAAIQSTENSVSDTITSEWIIERSMADVKNKKICYDFIGDVILHLDFSWSPMGQNVIKTDTGTIFSMNETRPFDISPLLLRRTSMEIQNVSKIVLNQDYLIPNDNIFVESICYGFYSNFEYYNNLSGKIRFEELTNREVRFKILLMGELNQMLEFKMDTILNEKISFTKLWEE